MRVFYECRYSLGSWLLVRYLADPIVGGYGFGRLEDEQLLASFVSREVCLDYLLSLADFCGWGKFFVTDLEGS